MRHHKLLLIIIMITPFLLNAQITTTPSSIAIGFESAEIEDDTLFVWYKLNGYIRSGYFDFTSSNLGDVGFFSHSFGYRNIASGESSFATNIDNVSSGKGASAFGGNNNAYGDYSVVLGYRNSAFLSYETVLGLYNRIHGGSSALFTVGNGDFSDASNAFMVTNSDGVAIGDVYPNTDLHIVHGDNGTTDGLKLESESNGNFWRFFAGGTTDNLALFHHSVTDMSIGVFDAAGNYGSPSDLRLKGNIEELPYGLATVMALNPKRYQFNHMPSGKRNIGFIAQETIEFIPEIVHYNQEEDQYHVNYDGFAVVAIKAIQELKEIIDKQQVEIAKLKEQVE